MGENNASSCHILNPGWVSFATRLQIRDFGGDKACFNQFFRIAENLGIYDAILYRRCHTILSETGNINCHFTALHALTRNGHFMLQILFCTVFLAKSLLVIQYMLCLVFTNIPSWPWNYPNPYPPWYHLPGIWLPRSPDRCPRCTSLPHSYNRCIDLTVE